MEKLHKLMQKFTHELSINFKKYMEIHEKVITKINIVPDPYNLSGDDKNELEQLLKDLLLTWNILDPIIGYMLEKNEGFQELARVHRDLTSDLNMDWFK